MIRLQIGQMRLMPNIAEKAGLGKEMILRSYSGDTMYARLINISPDIPADLTMNQAVTDIPCVLFSDELLSAYPDAKVILTSRDVDSWLVSMKQVFYVDPQLVVLDTSSLPRSIFYKTIRPSPPPPIASMGPYINTK